MKMFVGGVLGVVLILMSGLTFQSFFEETLGKNCGAVIAYPMLFILALWLSGGAR